MTKFLLLRVVLFCLEIIWSLIGSIWIFNASLIECSPITFVTILVNFLVPIVAFILIIVSLIFVFDPLSNVPKNDVIQKRRIFEYYLKKLFCCFTFFCLDSDFKSNEHYAQSHQQISQLLIMLFSNADLTLTDIIAGIMLINIKPSYALHILNRRKMSKKINTNEIPNWMTIHEASNFVRYALATYSWPYYLYSHNIGGLCDVCCSVGDLRDKKSVRNCSCCYVKLKQSIIVDQPELEELNFPLVGDDSSRRNLRAFKFIAKCEESDIIYANFKNEPFLSPFCVVIDHFRKTVIITIRGTLSMR
jgi:sn1-specific diacylglycerol lipase